MTTRAGTSRQIQARFRRAVDAFAARLRHDHRRLEHEAVSWPKRCRVILITCSTRPRRTSARSITCGCWPPDRPESSSARAISLPRPRFVVAAWPSAGGIPGHCIVPSASWPGSGRRSITTKLRQSLSEAEAVLVLNPVIAAMVEPYCQPGAHCAVGHGQDAVSVASAGRQARLPAATATGQVRDGSAPAVHGGRRRRDYKGVSRRPRGVPDPAPVAV